MKKTKTLSILDEGQKSALKDIIVDELGNLVIDKAIGDRVKFSDIEKMAKEIAEETNKYIVMKEGFRTARKKL